MKNKKRRDSYTRVTNILFNFSGLDQVDPSVVSKAAHRGTRVHKICEGIIRGVGEFDVDEELSGYVESFKKWWGDGLEVISIEERFWDDELEVTGQSDLIVKTPEGLCLVDFKTSSKPSKTWQVQGCAYAYLASKANYDIKKIIFLHLNKHGKDPGLHQFDFNPELFFQVYNVWKFFYC